MRDTQLLQLAVGINPPWCMASSDFDGDTKRFDIRVHFYETAVAQHLHIGLAALDLLKARGDTLHSRKLRSFDEPPFR